MEKWSQKAWKAAKPIYDKIIAHPFVQELAKGTLSRERFLFYLQQDALYIDGYSQKLAHVASRLRKKDQIESFIRFALDGTIVEKAMHETFLKDIPNRTHTMTPTCLLYTSVLSSQATAAVEVEAASVLPCFWVYQRVGEAIVGMGDYSENPYHKWIGTYGDPSFEESTRRAIEICDDLAENASPEIREMMTEIFVLCTKMEYLFWDSAYNLEKWKI